MPGSFEIPLLAKAMAKSGKFDAILTIGTVVGFSEYCLKLPALTGPKKVAVSTPEIPALTAMA